MTHIVQFTTLSDFMTDLAAGQVIRIYHELIEQRTATTGSGMSEWQLATIIRAAVADVVQSRIIGTHVATLTIPHGPRVVRGPNGRLFGPPGTEESDRVTRWSDGRVQHAAIIREMESRPQEQGQQLLGRGVMVIPADVATIWAANPLDNETQDTTAHYSPGGAGSPD